MSDCLFCKIAAGEIPADKVMEEDDLVVFRDINAQAPTHLLVIPRKHIASMNDVTVADAALLGRLLDACRRAAAHEKLTEYRIVNNCGESAGQSVFHIHLHLLGGRSLGWPPG
ncbi:MAG: HIT domain-containing protein [Acidobacteria bacterium]|nr:HIT domain-containing protein [Acidobacteriota bacterium]NIM61264.1 HIT domain-containing protein [Acidobacteriota bacterium]NIQ86667.1 HIT domain-containing protein [Acidobacteriota bacterium]NIT12024.1 HIT domain-containing protein [Acidobacteriota bacterium]